MAGDPEVFSDPTVEMGAKLVLCGSIGGSVPKDFDSLLARITRDISAIHEKNSLSVEELWVLYRLYEHQGDVVSMRGLANLMFQRRRESSIAIGAKVTMLSTGGVNEAIDFLDSELASGKNRNRGELFFQKASMQASSLIGDDITTFTALDQLQRVGVTDGSVADGYDLLGRMKLVERNDKLDSIAALLAKSLQDRNARRTVLECRSGKVCIVEFGNDKREMLRLILSDNALRFALGKDKISVLVRDAFLKNASRL
ncbi:MAG: hypothetical protein ABJZ55_05925 [Fuerstiella sp.]